MEIKTGQWEGEREVGGRARDIVKATGVNSEGREMESGEKVNYASLFLLLAYFTSRFHVYLAMGLYFKETSSLIHFNFLSDSCSVIYPEA